MSKRAERAKQLFLEGYNCTQAVVGAFLDVMEIDFDTAMKLASSFGGGFGRMREVCGAFSGLCIVVGCMKGYSDPKAKEEKAEHYRLIQELAEKFRVENGSIICRELLGEESGRLSHIPSERTAAYYKKRPCAELVYVAAAILEKELNL